MSTEGDLEEVLASIIKRRKSRDDYYLRQGKIVATRELAAHWKEWIAQEMKDLLILTGKLKNSSNLVLKYTVIDVEKRVQKLNKNFTRNVITPLNKIAGGSTKSKSEIEHMEKFQKAVMMASNVIIDLGKLRDALDDAIENAKTSSDGNYNFYS